MGKKNNIEAKYFYRYTDLAAIIRLLKNQQITLLDPMKWDDKNDVFFMQKYKELMKAETLLAICFVQGGETYHHWKLFSDGPHGVSINFEKAGLLSVFKKDKRIKHGRMQYDLIKDVEESLGELPLETSKLPFLKRYPYRGEKEYRVIYVDTEKRLRFKSYDIDLSLIKRIRLSPWMPKPLVKSVKETLESIRGCAGLEIVQSTVTDDRRWRRIAEEVD
ncbi:MAG: DUF2971 domain-containing protein [Candidatus Dadabacteria bacterium]|nr:DUF2971 domain-containing protein [Candidatus Dadabacteria bacterium]